ncbi:unnamed protein product [Mytilus edulis]|uniref:Uncharacterized protein n=1 Tax=Mytilus edulis TaxID=6550 RepID=A0A8S3TF61_MYTED|nr:unnamed protein product [Mytilus edulis]
MVLEIVTGIDSTMRRMETSMEKRLDDLKQDFLTVSARVRTLENQASDVNKKLSDCETSCQGVSNLFDQVSGQVKTNRRNINNHDTRIKKLEDNTIVRPGVPPFIESKEIESLKAAILDFQCRSMKNNLIFTGLHRVPGEDTEEHSKPWYNRKCSMSRTFFHKARKRYSFLKNAENRRKMRQASKEHKITLNKAFENYQQRAADELRIISKKDTKALWKILNTLNDS